MPEPSAGVLTEESEGKPSTPAREHQDVRTGRSPGQVAWARLKQDKVAIICFAIILFFLLVAIFAPFLVLARGGRPDHGRQGRPVHRCTPSSSTSTGCRRSASSSAHWLGVEPRLGRDLFARWAYGARPSLIIGFVAAAASTVVGVTLGLIAGYLGGVADKVISWVIDFFLSLPILLLVLAIVPIMQKRLGRRRRPHGRARPRRIRFWVLIVILFVFGWMGLARLVRGEVKSLREREFVQAARAIGVPTRSILFREILPNLVGPIIVSASIAVPAYITYEATLSYLGAGLVEPTASWGRTIADAQNLFATYPLWLWPSVIGLSLLVLALSLLGDSIRDAFDPTSRR